MFYGQSKAIVRATSCPTADELLILKLAGFDVDPSKAKAELRDGCIVPKKQPANEVKTTGVTGG